MFKYVSIDYDYSSCYYECDRPDLVVKGFERKEEALAYSKKHGTNIYELDTGQQIY